MATTKSVFSLLLFTLIAFSFLFVPHDSTDAKPLKVCKFDAIYNMGDSISDTGNLIRMKTQNPDMPFFRLPYGQTYFKNATGRCSNGLLMIDYIGKNHIKLNMLILMLVCQKSNKENILLLNIFIRLFFLKE